MGAKKKLAEIRELYMKSSDELKAIGTEYGSVDRFLNELEDILTDYDKPAPVPPPQVVGVFYPNPGISTPASPKYVKTRSIPGQGMWLYGTSAYATEEDAFLAYELDKAKE